MSEFCQTTNFCWRNGDEVLEILRNCFTVLDAFTFLVVSGNYVLRYAKKDKEFTECDIILASLTVSTLVRLCQIVVLQTHAVIESNVFFEWIYYLSMLLMFAGFFAFALFVRLLGTIRANRMFKYMSRIFGGTLATAILLSLLVQFYINNIVTPRRDMSNNINFRDFFHLLLFTVLSLFNPFFMWNSCQKLYKPTGVDTAGTITTLKKRFVGYYFLSFGFCVLTMIRIIYWWQPPSPTSKVVWLICESYSNLYANISCLLLVSLLALRDFSTKGFAKALYPHALVTLENGWSSQKFTVHMCTTTAGSLANSCADNNNDCPIVALHLARELPLWKRKLTTWKDFFDFPHPINKIDTKLHGSYSMFIAVLTIIVDYFAGFPYLWLLLMYGHTAKAVAGPKIDPISWLIVLVISPNIGVSPQYIPGPPRRFAHTLGAVFSTGSFILRMARPEYDFVARWILSLLIILYSMDVIFNMCVGCAMFQLLILLGLVPPDVCDKCSVVFTTKYQREREGTKSIPLQP